MRELADLAGTEAGMISDRRKALTAAKASALTRGPAARVAKAVSHAASLRLILVRIEAKGQRSLNAIARALTAEGIPTAGGATNWTPAGVARVKAKLAA